MLKPNSQEHGLVHLGKPGWGDRAKSRRWTGVCRPLLSKFALWLAAKLQLRLIRVENRGWRVEWIIEPVPHGEVDEDLLPQQRHQIRQTPGEAALELQVLDEQHRDQGGVDLSPRMGDQNPPHHLGGCGVEVFPADPIDIFSFDKS